MKPRYNRRTLLKYSGAVAAAAAGTRLFPAPALLAGPAPNSKLGVAVIGAANQGLISVNEIARLEERMVAFVDVDERQFGKTQKMLAENYPDVKFDAIERFFDYRKMLDKLHKQVDAVFVCIPDHHHATAAMMAMKLGKAVYVEKPLAHSIGECRALAAAAKKYRVITQMGNQGHSKEGIRVLCEYIWAGAVGNVLETYSWAPTGRGGTGGRLPTKPVPRGLRWDEWIGPAQYRDYHDDLHPALWRSWWEFGDGSLGDWGAHNLDGVFWALDLGQPASVEVLEQVGGSEERFPIASVVRWNYPARGDKPPLRVHWHDGYRGAKTANPKKEFGDAMEKWQIRPPIVLELEKKYKRQLGDGGVVFVGDKGVMIASNYCESPRILPEEKHRQFPRPPRKIPRLKAPSHQADFFRAMRDGTPAASDFEYAARLTEFIFLGCLAERAGLGRPIEWDAAAMTCTNVPEVNALVNRQYRKGWEL
jgi:predicted dehydrogenase